MVELRTDFNVARHQLLDADRGAVDLDLDLGSLDAAAHKMTVAENIAVFQGWEAAAMIGIAEASPFKSVALDDASDSHPRLVVGAVEALLQAGIGGPYGLARSLAG